MPDGRSLLVTSWTLRVICVHVDCSLYLSLLFFLYYVYDLYNK